MKQYDRIIRQVCPYITLNINQNIKRFVIIIFMQNSLQAKNWYDFQDFPKINANHSPQNLKQQKYTLALYNLRVVNNY